MFKGIWQSSGASGPIRYVKIFPRSYEKHFSLQQIPVEICLNVLNILVVHLHSFCFCFGLGLGLFGFWGQGGGRGREGEADFMRVSAKILYWTSSFHQANIFTPQRMEKSASYVESHVCKRRQNAWPQVTLQPQQSTGAPKNFRKQKGSSRHHHEETEEKSREQCSFSHCCQRSALMQDECQKRTQQEAPLGKRKEREDIRPPQLSRESMPEG